jgi:predicted AAA+ superfamily ATPase
MNIERPIYLQSLINRMHNGMIKIVTGMRRCGKSYLLNNLFTNHLLNTGVAPDHVISIDLEDILNKPLREPMAIIDYIYRHTVDNQFHYLIIDEVQLLSEFEDVLNTLLKKQIYDVYVTGSNARFLSKDVITTFRGRGDEVRIHPLNFAEYFSVQPVSPLIEPILNDYLRLGGLPQTVSMQDEIQKREYLLQLFKNTYLLDIKERYDIKNDDDLEELIDVIASSIGGLTNPNKIANTFMSIKKSSI